MNKLLNKIYLIVLSIFTPLVAAIPSFNNVNEVNAADSNFVSFVSCKDSAKYLPFGTKYFKVSLSYGSSNSMTIKKTRSHFY